MNGTLFFQGVERAETDSIVYKIASTEAQREAAFRLLHDSYVQAGLMAANCYKMRVTVHHLLPTTTVFIAAQHEKVIATVSLIGDGRLGLPMETVYANEVASLRDPCRWLGEVSSLACRDQRLFSRLDVVVGLMSLMAQHAQRHGIDHLLAAVHPKHARFYQRYLGFTPLGGERAYPAVCDRPAVALVLDLVAMELAPHPNYAIFFGRPLPDEQLRYSPISTRERRRFAPVAQLCQALAPPHAEAAALACA